MYIRLNHACKMKFEYVSQFVDLRYLSFAKVSFYVFKDGLNEFVMYCMVKDKKLIPFIMVNRDLSYRSFGVSEVSFIPNGMSELAVSICRNLSFHPTNFTSISLIINAFDVAASDMVYDILCPYFSSYTERTIDYYITHMNQIVDGRFVIDELSIVHYNMRFMAVRRIVRELLKAVSKINADTLSDVTVTDNYQRVYNHVDQHELIHLTERDRTPLYYACTGNILDITNTLTGEIIVDKTELVNPLIDLITDCIR